MSIVRVVLRGIIRLRRMGVASRRSQRQIRTLAIVPLTLSLVFLFSAGIAYAEIPNLILYGTFSTTLPKAVGVGIDQSSGDVYVTGLVDPSALTGLGSGQSRIDEYEASGKIVTPPSPFGNALYSGAVVNPTNGDIYVYGEPGFLSVFLGESAKIYTYSPAGTLLSSFPVPSSFNYSGYFSAVQIAVDVSGNVYVPVSPANDVLEYSSAGILLNTFTGSGTGILNAPNGVALDPAGNLWIADTGNNRIEELSSADTPLAEIKSEGVHSLALDPRGNVLAVLENREDPCGSLEPPCDHLVEYSSLGARLADVGAGSIGEVGVSLPSMVAVNESNGRVYVTDGDKNLVWIYGSPTTPVVEKELAAEVSTSEAKLGARVSPGGLETSYRFEYGTTSTYGQSTPFPPGNVGQGVTSRTAWASANGLQPGTTYHYRVIAKNALGESTGPDATFTTETQSQANCPNEPFRGGFSASLPDCRAYELVTPPNKVSAQPDTAPSHPRPWGGFEEANIASRDGNRLTYWAAEVMPGAQSGGLTYLATRGADGWSVESSLPLESYTGDRCASHDSWDMAFASDLATEIFRTGYEDIITNGAGGCGADGVEVVKGEPLGYENIVMRNNNDGSYRLINMPLPDSLPANAEFLGGSSNLSSVVFNERSQLTSNAPAGINMYVWNDGTIRLVNVLPDGSPAIGTYVATSADGSHIFFHAGGNLYVREHPEREQSRLANGDECTEPEQACTVQVDVSHSNGSGGGGEFSAVSNDGSRVFFTDAKNLTGDATAQPGEPDLYECVLSVGGSCALTDLTVAGGGGHANALGVAGISQDGAYVYFVADGVLAENENTHKEKAKQGESNLYVRHTDTTTFIAESEPWCAATNSRGVKCVQVSPTGRYAVLGSTRSLTGYDNLDSVSGTPDPEVFLFDVTSSSLVCASCDPSGAPPAAGGADIAETLVHYISDDGRVFFQTAEALLPGDTNGQIDVYEYEGGQVRLISTGTSSGESMLIDTSEEGSDVFFLTHQKLVPQDTTEEALSIYDARVNGGFPVIASPPECVTADACRAPVSPQPSVYGAPSSQTFSGVGNLMASSEVKPTTTRKLKPKKHKKAKRRVCKGAKHKRTLCAKHARHSRAAKSNKGGKWS